MAEGVEILKTYLPSWESQKFSQYSSVCIGVCHGKVGGTSWCDVNDIYIWCLETLL